MTDMYNKSFVMWMETSTGSYHCWAASVCMQLDIDCSFVKQGPHAAPAQTLWQNDSTCSIFFTASSNKLPGVKHGAIALQESVVVNK